MTRPSRAPTSPATPAVAVPGKLADVALDMAHVAIFPVPHAPLAACLPRLTGRLPCRSQRASPPPSVPPLGRGLAPRGRQRPGGQAPQRAWHCGAWARWVRPLTATAPSRASACLPSQMRRPHWGCGGCMGCQSCCRHLPIEVPGGASADPTWRGLRPAGAEGGAEGGVGTWGGAIGVCITRMCGLLGRPNTGATSASSE
jgi:hypothetical protein